MQIAIGIAMVIFGFVRTLGTTDVFFRTDRGGILLIVLGLVAILTDILGFRIF